MRINVGSQNKVKVDAVGEIISDYPHMAGSLVQGFNASSEVSDQPKSLEETIRGARNRARNAFVDCNYSFGIESGLTKVPYSKTGYMDICACVIYDGDAFHLGLSSAFECPKKVTDLMIQDNYDMNEAFYRAGLTNNQKLGSGDGAIGLLTRGRLTRKQYTKQAICTALIHLEL